MFLACVLSARVLMDNVHIVVDLKKHAISLEFVGKVTNTKWNVKFLGMDAECHSGS